MTRFSRIFVALRAILVFSKLCGFADFHIDSGGRFVFSDKLFVCSSAYHTLMVLVLFYVLAATRDQIVGSTSTTLVMFNASGLTLLFIVNKICQKFYAKKKIAPLWKGLGALEKNMFALNMGLDYRRIAIESFVSFAPTQVLLTCLVATQYYVSITMSSSKTTAFIFTMILFLIETERTVITGQFCSLLIVIRTMFKAISTKINTINPNENIQTTFRFLQNFHHELSKDARKTNRLYSFHLALSFGVDLLCFVTYTQLIVYDFLEGNLTEIGFLSMAWMVVLCSRILPIITAAHSCLTSVCDIRRSLGELWVDSDMFIVKKEINIFNLQIAHEEIKIMACGLFPIKLSLLLSIIGAVATYMIIVIQLNSHFTVLMLRFK